VKNVGVYCDELNPFEGKHRLARDSKELLKTIQTVLKNRSEMIFFSK
jgi:hypothetical protein